MKIFVWVHNRAFHSWSMFDEPCVHEDMYSKATAIVMANSEEEAISLLTREEHSWREEDLRRLKPKVLPIDAPVIIHTDIR